MADNKETLFRIDAVASMHAAGFKAGAKEAAQSVKGMRQEVSKYTASQATANRESNKTKDALAKTIVANKAYTRELKENSRALGVYIALGDRRKRLEAELRRSSGESSIAMLQLRRSIEQTVRETDQLVLASQAARGALHNERDAAIKTALGLIEKGKAASDAAESQQDLYDSAMKSFLALGMEKKAAEKAALAIAMKGHEAETASERQIRLAGSAYIASRAMDDERRKVRDLNFEFQRHRGVLMSNIRSQPLFAAAVAGITAALGPLSSLLGDVTAGAVALGGGLEPLMGNLVMVPALAGAAGQGLLTLGLAFHGVFKTLVAQGTTYQHNLEKLSKPAQEFVKTLRGEEFGNAFKELQLQLQTGLFDGLVKGMKEAMPLLKPLSQVLYDTAKAAGHMAEIWGKFLGSKEFGHEFLAVGERNRQTLTRIGLAMKYITDATMKLLVAAGPFIGKFTEGMVGAAKSIDNFITANKGSGDLRLYFGEVWERTKQWLQILGNSVMFFHNAFEAARPLTDTIMNAWVKGSKAAAEWAKNNQGLKDFFLSARAPLEALGHLVGSLATAIADLAVENQRNLMLLANTLADHVVPALKAVAEFFADMIPAISNALGHIGDAVKTILQNSGDLKAVLKTVLDLIANIADAAAEISKHFGATGLIIVGASALTGLRVAVSLMKTLVKYMREAAFERAGVSVAESGLLTLTPGKGVGRLVPKRFRKEADRGVAEAVERVTVRSSGKKAAQEAGRTALDAGVGGLGAAAVAGRAGISAALRTASIRAFQVGSRVIDRVPILAAGAAVMDTFIEGMKRKDVHEGAAAALTNVFSMGTQHFKDYDKIDKAGNKMLDLVEARVKDIAERRKLNIPVEFDINEKALPDKAFNKFIGELENAVDDTRKKGATWRGYFDELRVNVGMNMKRIETTMKAGSNQAKVATAANFNTAAAAVMKSMADMDHFTKRGIAQVEKYLRQALAVYGVKGRDATSYISTYIYRQQNPGSTGTGANEGVSKAGGGYITAPGLRGHDKRHIVAGDGEALLNHHQQRPVETALRNTYGFGLRELFHREQRPHYMAQGGFVGNRRWPMLSGDTDFGSGLGNRLEGLAEKAHVRIFVQDGKRTLGEQADRYAKYGPGRAAAPTPNAPHVRGVAADITPGQAVFGALASAFGLGFPVPGEPWHIQLNGSGGGKNAMTPAASIAQKIKRYIVDAKGMPGALAQGAVDTYQSFAQGIADHAVADQSLGDGSAPGGAADLGISGKGSPGRNMSLALSLMGKYGWNRSMWPSLKQLWTRESGWDEFAVNKSSGAYGIPQALGHGNVFALGDAEAQIKWGMNYIRERYGTPSSAWAHETAYGWYGEGGVIGTAAGRTPPPNIPLSQGPESPHNNNKKKWRKNPVTGTHGYYTDAEYHKLQLQADKRKKKTGVLRNVKSKPPIGLKHKLNKTKPKRKKPTSKDFKSAMNAIKKLSKLGVNVSGAEWERVAGNLVDGIEIKKKYWDQTDEEAVINGLFNKDGTQVPGQPIIPEGFELKDVLNWDGGIDAQSLDFIPGINHKVGELNEELSAEGQVKWYLDRAVDAYTMRATQEGPIISAYLNELNEVSRLVSFWKDRRDSAQNEYNRQVKRKGTWQDRVSYNQDEIDALRKWLNENADANSDSAKGYKKDARGRIQDLNATNRKLRKDKPAPSKSAKDALNRIEVYSNDLSSMTGKTNPDEPPSDVSSWSVGGTAGKLVGTYKNLTTDLGETVQKIAELKNDPNSGIAGHIFNIDQIKKDIDDWQGSHLAAQTIEEATGGGTSDTGSKDNSELLRLQLEQALNALQMKNIAGEQMDVFKGLAPYIGRFQHGGWVPQTGLAMLERGEYVVPEPDGPNPMYHMNQSASPVNVTLVLDGHAGQLVRLVDQRIDSKAPVVVAQQLGRNARMIRNAPGR